MDYGARGATHSPFPSATGEPQPLTPAPRSTLIVGGRRDDPQPPSGAAPASSAVFCSSQEEASCSSTK